MSLQPEGATASGPSPEEEVAACAPRDGGDGPSDGDRPCPSPSELLGRAHSVYDKDLIRDCSEAMAHNVLESFGAALVWRAKTWIKSLANVLALREQKRIDAVKAASSEGGVVEAEADGDEGNDADERDDAGDDESDDLMNSKEMQIIDAIVKSSEEVSVVNIKTSFRVLSNRVSHLNVDVAPSSISDPQEAASKKARMEDVVEYKLTHKLMFEATISMTSNDGVRYNGVKLQAPGFIQGTFANKAGSTGDRGETLTGVSISLDTDALALSLEMQSRLVVRRAAEAALVSSRCADGGPSHNNNYMESPHRVHHSAISPRYVLMSPLPDSLRVGLPSIPTGNELNEKEEMSELNEEEESKKAPVVSDEDTSPNATPSLTPTEQADLTNRHSSPLPALLSVANDELTKGD